MAKPERIVFPREITREMAGPLLVEGRADKVIPRGSVAFVTLPAPDRELQVTATEPELAHQIAQMIVPGTIAIYRGSLQQKEASLIRDRAAARNPYLYDYELLATRIEEIRTPKIRPDRFDWGSVRRNNHFNQEQYLEVTRMPEYQRLMAMRKGLQEAFLHLFQDRGYAKIPVPSLTASVAESGAEQFFIHGQAGDLSLVQSPQQMKQIMAEIYGAVVWTGSAFRNDPSITRWHLAEFTGLDIERQVHYRDKDASLQEVMNELTDSVRALHIEMGRHPQVMHDFNQKGQDVTLPLLPDGGIPTLTYEQAMGIARNARIQNWNGEWDRSAEKAVADHIRKYFKSDYYYVTMFPFKEKVFYTDSVNPDDPETLTYSFDLICRGVEIASGGLRVNDVAKLRKQMELKKVAPEQVALYLQHFERGASQTGGFGIGLERYMALVLDSTSRLMAPFPKTADGYIG